MDVALVNTNRYLAPPVIPVGLEYLVAPLELHGHRVEVCDLAFSKSPEDDLVSFLDGSPAGVLGFSVRNVDTAHFMGNRFFLDEISSLVKAAKEHTGLPTVAGGASSRCSAEALREYLGVELLVAGPGEKAFPAVVNALSSGKKPPVVTDGWAAGIYPDLSHPRGRLIDYRRYLEGGNPAGLEFRKGCNWECRFCVERARPVLTRDVPAVVREARSLVEAGCREVFICDSEVNLDLEDTNRFLGALASEALDLKWTGYFQPVPFDERMARLASASGLNSLTLSVNSWDLSGEESRYGTRDVKRFCRLCAEAGIKVAIDLLVGYPGEDRGSVETALEFLSSVEASTVGVNPYFRLYETIPAGEDAAIEGSGRLLGETRDNPSMLKPVYYSGIDAEWLQGLLSTDDRFILETGGTVNYERI